MFHIWPAFQESPTQDYPKVCCDFQDAGVGSVEFDV